MGSLLSRPDYDMSKYYRRERLLDIGAVGEVYLELDTRTNEQVAVKYIPRNRVDHRVRREVLNFSACQHSQIISFREVFLTPTHLAISMEYANYGNLLDFINIRGPLSEDDARWYFQQIVAGVDHCHFLDIMLRDIKPENTLLLNSEKDRRRKLLKLCDFGTSVTDTSGGISTTSVGTLVYASPEVITQGRNVDGRKADVWSIGVILFCMVFAQHPFLSLDEAGRGNLSSAYQRIADCRFQIPARPAVSAALKDLLHKLLVKDPSERMSIAELYRDRWFLQNLPRHYFQKLAQTQEDAMKIKAQNRRRWSKLLKQAAS